jgi:hypothetical protein
MRPMRAAVLAPGGGPEANANGHRSRVASAVNGVEISDVDRIKMALEKSF